MSERFRVYPEIQRIDMFDERWYQLTLEGGKVEDFRGVTTWLEAFPKGAAFKKWLKNNGVNADRIFKEAGEFGSKFHELPERTLLGDTVTWEEVNDIDLWERFITWCGFWRTLTRANEVKVDPQFIEYIVHDLDDRAAGTVDACIWVNGEPIVMDWKSGNYVGDEAQIQLSTYAMYSRRVFDLDIKRAWIIHMPAKKPNIRGYKIYEITEGKVEPIEQIKVSDVKASIQENYDDFHHTQKLYTRTHPNEKPKYKNYPTSINLGTIAKDEIVKDGLSVKREAA